MKFSKPLIGTLAAFACAAQLSYAQQAYPIRLEDKPVLHALPDSLKKESAVVILEERLIEMAENAEKKDYLMYRTVHHIIRLSDDKGVESFNTFTIPINSSHKLVHITARTILPDGKVKTVSEDQIKTVKNEEGVPEYRVAFEGVTPGAEVELLYTDRSDFSSFGTEIFQLGVPMMQSRFLLIVPERLRFDSKGYNGFANIQDSVAGGNHFYKSTQYNIPHVEDEMYSCYRPSLARVDYKLAYIDAETPSQIRRLTWTDLAKELYSTYYDLSDKELRSVDKFLSSIGVNKSDDEMKKMLAIEDYFKTNITISDNLRGDESALDFNKIAEKKLTTEKGYTKFFVACLAAAGVRHELGLASSRYGYPMDESLEQWDHLENYVVYLPGPKAYLAPTAVTFRYPFIPYLLCGTKGLFAKTTKLGDMVSALPDIRTMPHTAITQNGMSVVADVHFEPNGFTPVVNLTNEFKGYSASGLREIFLFAPKDKQKEAVQSVTGITDKPEDIENYTVEHTAFSDYTAGQPLKWVSTIHAPRLIEKAGPKYLFKAGDLIGKQAEMYHDDHRQLPIEIEYPHTLPRTLNIEIPSGYKVSNPDALRFNVVYKEEGKDMCGFISDYKIEGNKLVVNINEYYAAVSYPLAQYETFRKVINASADFNKVVLVLEKI